MLKLYEGMFLLNSTQAAKDWDAVVTHVHGILERHGASIEKSQKWGDRRLAYEIAGQKRATYMLVHFEAEGKAITGIHRDAGLSATIIRHMIVIDQDGDELPEGLAEEFSPATPQPEEAAKTTQLDAEPAPAEAEPQPAAEETPAAEPETAEPETAEPETTEPEAAPREEHEEKPETESES